MKAIGAKATAGVNIGSMMVACDNSGARIVRITGVKGGKTRQRTQQYAKIADHVKVSVRAGKPDMKGQVFDAVIVRMKKPYRRKTGERVAFEDNAVALLKDDQHPKGTQIKGPVAREIQERWKEVSKIADFVL